jgi:hypothetical protein
MQMTKEKFYRFARSAWRMRLYMLWKLPAAWFVGIRLRSLDEARCTVALPYRWRSQNPFRSIYFAAQCAAAEFSTGMLVLAALQERPPVSMLVVKMEGAFFKKASQTLHFTCEEGEMIHAAVQRAVETGEAQTLTVESQGTLPDGSVASRFRIEWSLRAK